MLLLILTLIPFIGCVLAALLPVNARNREAWLSAAIGLVGLIIIGSLFPQINNGEVVEVFSDIVIDSLPNEDREHLKKGITFCLLSLFLQNIFFIPAIITIGVSSIKLYKAIIADRRKENIKIQLISHTIVSLLMLLILIFSSFLENEISVEILKLFVKSI